MSTFEDISRADSTLVSRFHEDGYIVLEDLIDVDEIESLRISALKNFDELQTIIRAKNAIQSEHLDKVQSNTDGSMESSMGIGIKNCFKEIVQRHACRFEMPYKMDNEEFAVVLRCPRIMKVVRGILGEDCVVINKSLVISSPGADDQAWHSDGPHLSATQDLPCHCLNVFVPLVDVTSLNGPTQFRPGSVNMTRNLKVEMLKAMVRKTLRPIDGPTLRRGSVLLFDYRVLHRGTKNSSSTPRPVLVYTFAKPYYKDTLNFPKKSVFDT